MRILVVRFKLMGDVILSSSICSCLKKTFPDSTIDFVTYTPYSELFQHHPSIDNVYGISVDIRKSPIKYLRYVKKISRNNYDIIIDAQSTAKSNFFVLFAKTAEFKISSARKRFSIGYTDQVNKPEVLVDKVKERLALLEPLTRKYSIAKTEAFQLLITEQESRDAKAKLVKMGVDLARPLFVFAVSANEPFKKWCRTDMKKLVDHCKEKYDVQVLLFAGLPNEANDVAILKSELSSHNGIFSEYPIESIRCLLAIFSLSDLFVGNEGGPRHIAHAVGTPTVSVFSPHADKAEWFPAGSGKHWAIEWRDVVGNEKDFDVEMEVGDSNYYRLYNSIKAESVIPLIDLAVLDANICLN